MLAGPGLSLDDIGRSLSILGDQLREIGAITNRPVTREDIERGYYVGMGDDEEQRVEQGFRHAQDQDRLAQTLSALRTFRRSYYYWERVAVEHALNEGGFSQRRAAQLLGVGLSTINRWAQNPVASEDED